MNASDELASANRPHSARYAPKRVRPAGGAAGDGPRSGFARSAPVPPPARSTGGRATSRSRNSNISGATNPAAAAIANVARNDSPAARQPLAINGPMAAP